MGGQGVSQRSFERSFLQSQIYILCNWRRGFSPCLAHKYLDRSGSPATTPLPTPQEEWVVLNSSVKSHTILKYPSSPHVFLGQQTCDIESFSYNTGVYISSI